MNDHGSRNPSKGFARYFKTVPALTNELRLEVYRLRYEVYCSDLRFEPLNPNGIEVDEYDRHSVHCLFQYRDSGVFIGCTRIILAKPEDPSYPFAFEKTCKDTLDRSIIDPAHLAREKIAEASRLAVIKEFRHRRADCGLPLHISGSDYGGRTQPRFPYLALGLYLCTIALANQRGVETLFMLTEFRLAEHLQKLGFRMRRIGGAVEHRGKRVPSALEVPGTIANLRRILTPLYETISGEVAAAFRDVEAPISCRV